MNRPSKKVLIKNLPKAIRERALEEMDRQKELRIMQKHVRPKWLINSFLWEQSLDGKEYWESINNRYGEESKLKERTA